MASSLQIIVDALKARASAAVDPALMQQLDQALDAHKAERKEIDNAREIAADAKRAVADLAPALADLREQLEGLAANPPAVDLSGLESRLSDLEGRAAAAGAAALDAAKAPAAKPKPKAPAKKS